MEGFQQPAQIINLEKEAVSNAKQAGQKVIGYSCTATPLELIIASGALAYRIKGLGNSETELADAHLSRFNCGFCRSCLQLALNGTYDFLDGLIETNGCDHMQGMYENWQNTRPANFFHFLRVPHTINPDMLDWFVEELEMLRAALGNYLGRPIEDEDLALAIDAQDETIFKMKQIYESRWGPEVRIKGSEVMALMLLRESLPTSQFNKYLSDFKQVVSSRAPLEYRARLLVGGSATDEIELIAGMESLGGLVVADALCLGGKLFRNPVESQNSPIEDLASSYLKNLLCPRMTLEYRNRKQFITGLIESSSADGVVLFTNQFCDMHGVDNVLLRKQLESEGMPVLVIEKEYGAQSDMGRIKTRLQAFLEKIGK